MDGGIHKQIENNNEALPQKQHNNNAHKAKQKPIKKRNNRPLHKSKYKNHKAKHTPVIKKPFMSPSANNQQADELFQNQQYNHHEAPPWSPVGDAIFDHVAKLPKNEIADAEDFEQEIAPKELEGRKEKKDLKELVEDRKREEKLKKARKEKRKVNYQKFIGQTLQEAAQSLQETADWHTQDISKGQRNRIRTVLALIHEPGVVATLGRLEMKSVIDKLKDANNAENTLASLRAYAEAASSGVPFKINEGATLAKAIDQGSRLELLKDMGFHWMMYQRVDAQLFSKFQKGNHL